MNQQQTIEVYMAKQSKVVSSYLVTLIDGTGSMSNEYQPAVKAHQDIFQDLTNQKMDYQWEEQIYPFLPFRSAGSGNISNTFKVIFEKLLNGNYPSNITFLFVSDGQEHFNQNEIQAMIDQMKQKYLIQFICVAVGDSFPNQISNQLRDEIHNQNQSCPAVFKVERKYQSSEVLYKSFSEIFQEIKRLINVQDKHFEVNQPVFQTLVQQQPTTKVIPNEPFFRKIDGKAAPIILEDEVVKPTDKPDDISKLIVNSVEKELILTAKDPKHDYKEGFSKIAELSQQLLDQAKFENDQHDEIKKQASAQIFLATNIAEGNLDLKKNEKEMTDLQKDIRNYDKIIEYVEKNAQEIDQKDWTDERAKKRMQRQFNNTKLACYAKSKTTKKELDLIESIWKITVEGLNNYKKVIEKDQQCNINKLLVDLKELLDKQLQKIFEKLQSNQLLDKHIHILKEINDTLKDMHQLIQEQDNVKANEVIQFIDLRAKPITGKNFSKIDAIFDQIDEFEYLPKSVQKIFRDDEDELEKVVMFVFDENDSMVNEIQAAKSNYLQVFSRLPQNQKISISWKNGKFQLLENNQQQFDSLFKLVETQQAAYDLKNKCIHLCLISDGRTEYDQLHKAIEEIQLNQYLIKFIYFPTNKLQDDFLEKFKNRQASGKPLIKVIPRIIANKLDIQDKYKEAILAELKVKTQILQEKIQSTKSAIQLKKFNKVIEGFTLGQLMIVIALGLVYGSLFK